MPLQFPITFSLAPIPTGQALNGNQYGQLLVANLQAFISGQFLTGQVGGTAPTSNIGPWLNNGVWYYWDPGSSTYVPQSSLGAGNYAPDTGTVNAYVVSVPFPGNAYVEGMVVWFSPGNTNTGASTLNASFGVVPIVNPAGLALKGGELVKNSVSQVVFDGANFRIVGPCSLSYTTTSATQIVNVNCAGYTSVSISVNWTAGAGMGLNLNNLQQAASVNFLVQNNTGISTIFSMAATTPAGSAYGSISALQSGVLGGAGGINMIAVGLSISSTLAMQFTGNVPAPGVMVLSH